MSWCLVKHRENLTLPYREYTLKLSIKLPIINGKLFNAEAEWKKE